MSISKKVNGAGKNGLTAVQKSSVSSQPQRDHRLPQPGLASSVDVLALQRYVGNAAVSRLIQTKLVVGPSGDAYEREADAVASRVMGMQTAGDAGVQRQAEGGLLQEKPLKDSITPFVRRAVEEEEPLQGKRDAFALQRAAEDDGFEAGADFESRLSAQRGGGSQLPNEVRSFMEPRFGADFGSVRVHTDSQSVQLNRDVHAQAFTHGQDIYMGEGRYQPETPQGKQLLAHELTHVVQQTGGQSSAQRMPDIQRSPLTEAINAGSLGYTHNDTYRSQDELKAGKGQPDFPFSREWYIRGGNKVSSNGDHLLVHAHFRGITNQVIERIHIKSAKNKFGHDHTMIAGDTEKNLISAVIANIDKDIDINGSSRNPRPDLKLRQKFGSYYSVLAASKK